MCRTEEAACAVRCSTSTTRRSGRRIRDFIAAEVVPVYDQWIEASQVPREFYKKLGDLGVFGIEVPEEYGGAGETSFKFHAVITEECARAGVSFGGSSVHTALCLPYLLAYAAEEQKRRWCRRS